MNKKRIIKFLFYIVCLSSSVSIYGQRFDFINYNEAPVMYNPALLSSIDRMQLSLNYRNNNLTPQVSNNEILFGLQIPLNLYTDKFSLGTLNISGFDERSNYAPSFKNTGIAIAYSQPVQISLRSTLSFGLQYNFNQKGLNISSFTTGNQWNNYTGFNQNTSNGEEQLNNYLTQNSINSGIYWQLRGDGTIPKAYAGASIFNLNRPNESFTSQVSRGQWQYFANGGYTFADNNIGNIALDAVFMRQQQQNVAGLGFRAGMYYSSGNTSSNNILIVYGKYFSNYVLMAGAELDQHWLSFGISYDFLTAQTFNTGDRTNAVELYLKVRFGRSGMKKASTTVSNYNVGQKRVFATERKTEVIETGTSDAAALKKVEAASDTTSTKYVPMKLALKRDFKFAFNDATLNDESKAYLDELIILMNRNKNMTLEIIGHTDDVGSKEGNQKISLQRAQIVADYFINKGIDKNRLTVTGKMDLEPLFPNTTPEYRAKNRRVEFIILN